MGFTLTSGEITAGMLNNWLETEFTKLTGQEGHD